MAGRFDLDSKAKARAAELREQMKQAAQEIVKAPARMRQAEHAGIASQVEDLVRQGERISVTREDGGKENCLRNRLENPHFRALRARQMRNRPLPAPLATLWTKTGKTLHSEAIWFIRRVGIGESKWKSQVKCGSAIRRRFGQRSNGK